MPRRKGAARRAEDEEAKTFVSVLCEQLKNLQLCSCSEEYTSVADAIASSSSSSLTNEEPPTVEDLAEIVSTFVDYFEEDVQEDDAKIVIHKVITEIWGDDFADSIGWTNANANATDANDDFDDKDDYQDENDGDYVGDGECQLCEREVKLTRHHLIPKTTWPRIKKRLWNAAATIEAYHSLNDEKSQEKKDFTKSKLEKMMCMTDISDIPTVITHDSIRAYLFQVCLLCRQCHSAVHRIHTEMELATEYNSIDRLLSDDEILKFGKWASKQRPGKYAI